MYDQKRKKKIVSKNLQYQILFSVMASGISIYLISAFGLRLLMNQIFQALELADLKPEASLAIVDTIDRSATYLIGFTSVCLVISWVSALYLSNRIAGPVYKINQVIDERLAGNKEARIQTRKHDFFGELVEKLNKLLDLNQQ